MTSRHHIGMSRKLSGVSYSLRGPLAAQAERMRAAGEDVLTLSLGDPATHGLPPAREVVQAVRDRLDDSCGYSGAAGLPEARDAVAQHYRGKGLDTVRSCDVYLGNGVSELAPLSLHALLDPTTRFSSRHRTIPCGPPPSSWQAGGRCTIRATKPPTGTRTRATSPAG